MFKVLVPPGLGFGSLRLRRSRTGRMVFSKRPFRTLCEFNGLDFEQTVAMPDVASWIISEWYVRHRKARGAPNSAGEYLRDKHRDKRSDIRRCQRAAIELATRETKRRRSGRRNST